MAEEFKNGVSWFLKGKPDIDVWFPEGKTQCHYCPFCRAESDLKRYWCRLTNQMIYNPYQAELPDYCPIVITGEIRGKKEEKQCQK